MTNNELLLLEALLKKFRKEYAWDPREKPADRTEHLPSKALRAVRSVRHEGPFYKGLEH